MEIKSLKNEEGIYQLVFGDDMQGNKVEIAIEFVEIWSLAAKDNKILSLSERMGFNIVKWPAVEYPFDFKQNILSIPIHIPNLHGRYLFKACFDYFAQETSMPAQVAIVEHPGYPLMVVNFDKGLISDDLIERILETILNAIQAAEIKMIEQPKQEKNEDDDDDDIDDIDNAEIIEYELDDELLKYGARVPVLATFESIDKDDDND
jgi:hypothetical protein